MLQRKINDQQCDDHDAEIGQIEKKWRFGEAGKWARNETDAKGATGQFLRIQGHELDDDGHAEGGDRQIIGFQPERRHADNGGGKTGDNHRAEPADEDRQIEPTEPPGRIRRRQQGRGIGADRYEAGEPDIEEAGQAPLQVQAEGDEGEDQRCGQEESAVANNVHHRSLTPKRPIGRMNSTAIRMMKEMAARHSAPIS